MFYRKLDKTYKVRSAVFLRYSVIEVIKMVTSYKVNTEKEEKIGRKHHQILMSIVGKFLYKLIFFIIYTRYSILI